MVADPAVPAAFDPIRHVKDIEESYMIALIVLTPEPAAYTFEGI